MGRATILFRRKLQAGERKRPLHRPKQMERNRKWSGAYDVDKGAEEGTEEMKVDEVVEEAGLDLYIRGSGYIEYAAEEANSVYGRGMRNFRKPSRIFTKPFL